MTRPAPIGVGKRGSVPGFRAWRSVVPVPLSRSTVLPLLPVAGADLHVPLIQGGSARYVNLDYAAGTPALDVVAAHVARPQSSHAGTRRYTSHVNDSARDDVARFAGARPDDVVVFTDDALDVLASAVPGEVVHVEHHANLLAPRRVAHRVVVAAETAASTVDRLAAALAERPAALVVVTGASGVTGECTPIREIAAIAHRHGARLAVDAGRLAARGNIAALGADYVALSGHTLYAPVGTGALIGPRDWLDAASPERHGGGPDPVGVAALAASCRALDALPAGTLEAHERALLALLIDGLDEMPDITVHRSWPDVDPVGLVSFSVHGYHCAQVAAYLAAEHGIGVGAHPRGVVRASIGVGSSLDDIDRLLDALWLLVASGPSSTYPLADGCYPLSHPCDEAVA